MGINRGCHQNDRTLARRLLPSPGGPARHAPLAQSRRCSAAGAIRPPQPRRQRRGHVSLRQQLLLLRMRTPLLPRLLRLPMLPPPPPAATGRGSAGSHASWPARAAAMPPRLLACALCCRRCSLPPAFCTLLQRLCVWNKWPAPALDVPRRGPAIVAVMITRAMMNARHVRACGGYAQVYLDDLQQAVQLMVQCMVQSTTSSCAAMPTSISLRSIWGYFLTPCILSAFLLQTKYVSTSRGTYYRYF